MTWLVAIARADIVVPFGELEAGIRDAAPRCLPPSADPYDRPEAASVIGVEPEAAPFRFGLFWARVVGRHRRRIDDHARAGWGNDSGTLSRRGVAFRLDGLRRERGRRLGR